MQRKRKGILVFLGILVMLFLFVGVVWATNGGPEGDVRLGQYALPAILTVILGVIYKVAGAIPDRFKPVIAIGVGIVLGLVALGYAVKPWTFPNIVDYALYGLMAGAASVGLYEISRSVRKPRQ